MPFAKLRAAHLKNKSDQGGEGFKVQSSPRGHSALINGDKPLNEN